MIDDSRIGRAVVQCECGKERWYGYGACQHCGAFLPDNDLAPDPFGLPEERLP